MTHQEKIYRELAKEYPLPLETIERICRYQYKFLAEHMATDDFKAIRLPFWGVYKPMKGRLQRYLKKHGKQEEEQCLHWFQFNGVSYVPVSKDADADTEQGEPTGA